MGRPEQTDSANDKERTTVAGTHLEQLPLEDPEDHGFIADSSELPKGYYKSPSFIGTICAVGFASAGAVGGFALAAPNLSIINADIGPVPGSVVDWVSLVYTLGGAVGLLLVGRLSDLFGRRWYMIGGSTLALVGSIIAATAQTIPVLIGAVSIIGVAAAAQLSFTLVSNELVPMKHRFLMNGIIYLWSVPISGIGPAVSKAFVLQTSAGWRGGFYLMIAVNATAAILYTIFYFPPTFEEKFSGRTKLQQLKDFDFLGACLFTAGLVLFLLGLSSGGTVYPWDSAIVISFLVVGVAVLVAFALWEIYAPLREPLLPVKLFKRFSWVAVSVDLGLGASVYYAMAIIWPQMVAVLYTDDGGASMRAGWLNTIPGITIVAGQITAGPLARHVGKTKIQGIVCLLVGGSLLAGIASCGVGDLARAAALMAVGNFFIGWLESILLVNAGIDIANQRDIGVALGAATSMRSTISTFASTIYLTVLSNRLATTIQAVVPPALVAAGLPRSQVEAFLTGLTTGNLTGVQGLTPSIATAGKQAYQKANAMAFSTVFLTTLAFTGVAVVLSFFLPNVDDAMSGQVSATLHQRREKRANDGKEV